MDSISDRPIGTQTAFYPRAVAAAGGGGRGLA